MKKMLQFLIVLMLAGTMQSAYADGKAELWEVIKIAGKFAGKAAGAWWKSLTPAEKELYKAKVKNAALYKECPTCYGYRAFPCPGETVQTVNGPVRLPCVGGVVNMPAYQDMWGSWYTQPVRHILCSGYGAICCPQCKGNGYVNRW